MNDGMSSGLRRTVSRPGPARGFTLIEMLMVIGIIGLMIGIAVPFLQGISQGTKLETATRELHYTLLLARQHAITRRERVYVVFPSRDDAFSAQGVNHVAFRAYGVCTADEYIREWAFLPTEVFFDPNYPTAASGNNLFRHNDYQVTLPGRWTGGQPALAFRTDGSLVGRNRHPEVALGEGRLLNPAVGPELGPTRNKIQVYGFTGMPQVMRLEDAQ